MGYEYLFPGDPFVEDPVFGDSPDLPDARQHTDIPGGPPTYLLYLTAAEIGPVQGRDGSLRYHPALVGYRGSLYHEVWMNVPGSKIADAASAVASRPPNEVRFITASEAPWFSVDAPSTMGDHYFERSRGYIVPDSTGNHVFMIAGDDESELWLSTAASPDNAVRIAHVSNWTGYRNFTQNASQTSAPVRLRAGSRYYVEILHKEGNGLDHCSVAWIPPGGSDPVIIPSVNLQCLPLDLIEGGGNTLRTLENPATKISEEPFLQLSEMRPEFRDEGHNSSVLPSAAERAAAKAMRWPSRKSPRFSGSASSSGKASISPKSPPP